MLLHRKLTDPVVILMIAEGCHSGEILAVQPVEKKSFQIAFLLLKTRPKSPRPATMSSFVRSFCSLNIVAESLWGLPWISPVAKMLMVVFLLQILYDGVRMTETA